MNNRRILVSSTFLASALLAALGLVLVLLPRGTHADSGTVAQYGRNPNEYSGKLASAVELDEMLTASLAGPGYLVLPPAAFTWDGYNTGAGSPGMFFMSIAGGYLTGEVPTNACLLAPVQLPQGIRITGIEARLQDSSTTLGEHFQLWRTSLTSGVAEKIAEIPGVEDVTGGLVGLVDNTVQNNIVDNMYTYQVTTCVRPDILLYGVRVGYAYSVALPLITR